MRYSFPMEKIKKYKFSLFIFVTLIALGFCFRQSITSTVLGYSLKSYFHFKYQAQFNAKSIDQDHDHWIVKNPTLSFKDIALSADQMPITFDFWERQADIQIENGRLFKNNQENAHFNWKGIVGNKLEGSLEVYKDPSNRIQNALDARFIQNHADIRLNQVDASFANFIIDSFVENNKNWIIHEGNLDGKIDLAMDDFFKSTGIIHFNQIVLENPKLSLLTQIPKATLHLNKGLEFIVVEPLSSVIKRDKTPIWELNEILGSIRWIEYHDVEISLCGEGCHSGYAFPLYIVGKATLNDNTLHTLTLDGQYAGLEAKIVFDSTAAETNVHVYGEAEKFVALFPETLGSKLKKKIGKDPLNIEAVIRPLSSGAIVQGVANLHSSHSIFFGMILKEEGFFNLDSGWFHAEDIPLEKYVAPVIFDTDQLHLHGQADVSGVFDLTSLVLHYNALHLNLSSKHFELNCEKLAVHNNNKPAVHYFDFSTGAHGGQIPVENASYLEKNSGLVFTDISANITLGQQSVYVTDIESYCEGIFVTGSLDVDFCHSNEGYVNVGIYPDTIHGNMAEVVSLLSRYHSIPLPNLSLEGTVSLKPQGGYIHFAFQQQGLQTEAFLQGTLTEVGIKLSDYNASIHDLSAHFEYDHLAKTFELSDIQSTMVFENKEAFEEYALVGDHIKFKDVTLSECDFDLWLGDKNRDILRVVGRTQAIEDSKIECLLDQELSHFGDVHPDHFQFIVKDLSTVDFLHMEFEFKLATMLKDIQRLSRTGLLHISEPLLKELNALKTAEGDFKVDIQYENQKALLTYLISSQNCQVEKYAFKECLLEGKKKGSQWTIEQLKLDDISLAADFTHEDDVYIINFLGMRSGQSLLVGLEGNYIPHSNRLNAKINLLEINLEYLNEWSALTNFVKQYQPQGELRSVGKLLVDWSKQGIHVDANLTTSLKQWELNGMTFEDASNFSVNISSDQNITVNHFKSGIKERPQESVRANFEIDNLDYKLSSHELFCDVFKFHIPSQQIVWTMQQLQKAFPDYIKPGMLDVISKVKSGQSLLGSVTFKAASKHLSGQISLPPSQYNLLGYELPLQNVTIEFNPFEVCAKTSYLFEGMPLWFSTKIQSSEHTSGTILFSFQEPQTYVSNDAISLAWKLDSANQLSIYKISGSSSGVKTNLDVLTNESQETSLIGELEFDFSSNKISQIWGVDGKFSMSGKWLLLPKGDLSNRIHFAGKMVGSECMVQEYQCESLSLDVEGVLNRLSLKNVKVSDPAGILVAKSILLTNDAKNRWRLAIPELQMTDFYPSLLRRKNKEQVFSDSSFAIRKLELENLSGNLFEPSSFTAKGEALCVNPPRDDKLNDIWKIPTDALENVGANLAVLTPVTGTVEFQLEDSKVYLMKLKDVYSAGRLSKFYLPKKAVESSYIDFKGNLFMQFRIKQTSLLYKFAELFTVTVKGTVWNPSYSILKQNDND